MGQDESGNTAWGGKPVALINSNGRRDRKKEKLEMKRKPAELANVLNPDVLGKKGSRHL